MQMASPLLWASWLGDVDAMRLLIDYGADINQIQRNQHFESGVFGPPLLVANGDAATDLIFAQHPRLDVEPHEGYSIPQELVLFTTYSTLDEFVQKKMAWLQRKGLKFKWQAGSEADPVRVAHGRQSAFASPKYAPVNPFLLPGTERARLWGEIAASLEAIKAP